MTSAPSFFTLISRFDIYRGNCSVILVHLRGRSVSVVTVKRIFGRNHATRWKESSLRANDRTSNVRLPRVKTKLRCKYIYVVVRKGGHARCKSPCIIINDSPSLFRLTYLKFKSHDTIDNYLRSTMNVKRKKKKKNHNWNVLPSFPIFFQTFFTYQ